MLGRAALLRQARAARQTIEQHGPDRIVPLGGGCLSDLAPMAYLDRRYGGNLGVLWVEAHTDVLTPEDVAQGNAQVLGALLGRGDPDLVGEVATPVQPSRVMYTGLDAWMPVEQASRTWRDVDLGALFDRCRQVVGTHAIQVRLHGLTEVRRIARSSRALVRIRSARPARHSLFGRPALPSLWR